MAVGPFVLNIVDGEKIDEEEAEIGLVVEEPQLDSNGLIESPDTL